MGELQKISQATGLSLFSQGQARAIDARRQMSTIPQVAQALTPVERSIFAASIKKPIADYTDEELARNTALIVKKITLDEGIKSISEHDVTRFMQLLKTYYSQYSLHEIRLAFELALVGELDEYLPKDRDGNPDKSHYQSFNAAFISKILQAYGKRRREVEANAYSALPAPERKVAPETISFYSREWKMSLINFYLAYKYRGKLSGHINLYRVYEKLSRVGLAEPYEITESDKKEAVARLLSKVHTGLIKEFIGECIRYQQTKHSDVAAEARSIAIEKALARTFDRMAKDEVQITDYIRQDGE